MRKLAEPYLLLAERALNRLEGYVPETADAFLEQRALQDAILLQMLQIGGNFSQLRNRFSEKFKRAPESWDQIIGLRNTIAHGYQSIRIMEIWQFLAEDLDELRDSISMARSERWFDESTGGDYSDGDSNCSM